MNVFSKIKDFYDTSFSYCDNRWCDNRLTPHKRKVTISLAAVFAITAVFYLGVVRAPERFPAREIMTIEEGLSIAEAAEHLKQSGVIRSAGWLSTLTRVFGGSTGIVAGDYYFEKKGNLFSVAWRVMAGAYHLDPVKVILYEGLTRKQMADTLARQLPEFSPEQFLIITKGREGYLFPDTYRFLPNETAEGVARALQKNFFNQVAAIEDKIVRFGRPLEDVVIMASLLEREARRFETKRTIAGILWKRLDLGMPLQVDAVFVYILGKGSADLTLDDLAVDSPYNTYKYAGLPPGAIANPGLDSLLAAVTPVESDYFYFLSDAEGNMHYAATFEAHKQNKSRYIR